MMWLLLVSVVCRVLVMVVILLCLFILVMKWLLGVSVWCMFLMMWFGLCI